MNEEVVAAVSSHIRWSFHHSCLVSSMKVEYIKPRMVPRFDSEEAYQESRKIFKRLDYQLLGFVVDDSNCMHSETYTVSSRRFILLFLF